MAISFWQFASLSIQIVEMVAYLSAINKYKGKLENFADQLGGWADENRDRYLELRSCDPDFYEYYKSHPEYSVCNSNIQRGKGAAFAAYGTRLRRSLRTNRGYTPLAKVHLNNMIAPDAVAQSGLTRAVTCIKENKYVDNHVLEGWSMIVNAPVGVERYHTAATSTIIQGSFRNLKALGQGFNSAGAAFGTQLYKVLN